MKYTKEQVQTVREIDIATQLGERIVGRRKMINCPHPNHDDRTPSFELKDDNSFRCYGLCDTYGRGWIDFCEFLGYSFEEIMQEYVK